MLRPEMTELSAPAYSVAYMERPWRPQVPQWEAERAPDFSHAEGVAKRWLQRRYRKRGEERRAGRSACPRAPASFANYFGHGSSVLNSRTKGPSAQVNVAESLRICAGARSEPPMCEPSSSGTKPVASAAAEPPDDPPGVRDRSQGLLVVP